MRSQFLMEKLSHAQLSSQPGWSQPAPAEGEAVKGHTGKAQTSTSHSPPSLLSPLLCHCKVKPRESCWFCPINVTFPRESALGKQAEPSTGPDRQEANPRHQHRQWEFGIRGHTADGFTRAPTQKHGEDLSRVIFSSLSKNWRWIHPTGTA